MSRESHRKSKGQGINKKNKLEEKHLSSELDHLQHALEDSLSTIDGKAKELRLNNTGNITQKSQRHSEHLEKNNGENHVPHSEHAPRRRGSMLNNEFDTIPEIPEDFEVKAPVHRRGRRMSLPAVLSPLSVENETSVSAIGSTSPNTKTTGRRGSIPLRPPAQSVLESTESATLSLRMLRRDLGHRRPKTITELKANPVTSAQEFVEDEEQTTEQQRHQSDHSAFPSDLQSCRYLRRQSVDEEEISIEDVFRK